MGDLNNEQSLISFSPELRKNIKEVCVNAKVGLSSMPMKIKTISKKNLKEDAPVSFLDHFALEIPYAGKYLSWEIIFSDENYEYAPDFMFPDDMFLSDPDVDLLRENLPSLENWNVNNEKALTNVIKELLQCYKKYQVETLETKNIFSSLYQQYNALIECEEFNEGQVEVLIDKNDYIHFMINLNVDTSSLPEYLQSIIDSTDKFLNPGEDTATLRITFYKPEGGRIVTDLSLSPRLQQILGPSQSLHIPTYNKSATLLQHIVRVNKLLDERVEQIVTHYKMKNEFISSFLSVCSYSLLEYDNFCFSKIAFLCEVHGFLVFVQIDLGRKFPQEKPVITLRSIYHMKQDKPIVKVTTCYPYSPTWTVKEMIKRIINNLEQQIMDFKTSCQIKTPN